MLFANAVFNVFTGVFDVRRRCFFVVSVFDYSFPICLCPYGDDQPLWSGASNRGIMHILPAERKFMLLSMAEAVNI